MIALRRLAAATMLTALPVFGGGLAESVQAAECPGNPNALGTSRTLVIDPSEHTRLGMMQYRETLPLADHEVVLTFDDGPLPPNSNHALDILASECVKATFFLVGRMAHSFPDTVRRIHADGHTIGTHSQNHPLTFHKMPIGQAEHEIDEGIASVTAAVGDPNAVAPFFRVPGLLRRTEVEQALDARNLMTWSADFPADDWKHISANEVMKRALQRIEARGRGVLLLHDIQPATVHALPGLLKELKARGYRIVQVVPATAELPKTATREEDWLVHAKHGPWSSPSPQVTIEMLLADPILPTPDPDRVDTIGDLGAPPVRALLRTRAHRVARNEVPLPPAPVWPHGLPADSDDLAQARASRLVLPVPSLQNIDFKDDPIRSPAAAPGNGRWRTGALRGGAATAAAPSAAGTTAAAETVAPPPPTVEPHTLVGSLRASLLGRWPFSGSGRPSRAYP